ncbi:hypothetical protein CKA32_004887 [Geitlerinema sp. FC II]|nr:hypothetical protein CKA32_004887 [Geitlerinema sp. FC II]
MRTEYDSETGNLEIQWGDAEEPVITQFVPVSEPEVAETPVLTIPTETAPVAETPASELLTAEPSQTTEPVVATSPRTSNNNEATIAPTPTEPEPTPIETEPETPDTSNPVEIETTIEEIPEPQEATPPSDSIPSPPTVTPTDVIIAETLATGTPDDVVSTLDELFETEFEEAAGENLDDDTETVSAETIRQTLRDLEVQTQRRAVVIYAKTLVLPDNPDTEQLVLAMVVPDGPPIVKTLNLPTGELDEQVQLFLQDINVPDSDSYLTLARQLYDWLIAPLETAIESRNVDLLVFSLDAGLRHLPLAALHDGEQFLIERFSFGTIPSVSLTDTRYRRLGDDRVLAMGASEFPNSTLPPLPAVPMELAAIVNTPLEPEFPELPILGSWNGRGFLNRGFTQRNLQRERQRDTYAIVHLATQAKFVPHDRDSAYVQFWDGSVSLDGLRSVEWYAPPTVELLVLSACRTALGDRQAEMGFAGLAVRAGVKSAIASLWKINDLATLGAIAQFYVNLQESPLKAEALQQAQLALLRGELTVRDGKIVGNDLEIPLSEGYGDLTLDLSHPYYWAGFTTIGSPW